MGAGENAAVNIQKLRGKEMREQSVHEPRCIKCLFDVYAQVETTWAPTLPHVAAMGTSGACGGRASSETPRLQNVLTGWLLSTRSRACESSKGGVIDVEVAVLDRRTVHRDIC